MLTLHPKAVAALPAIVLLVATAAVLCVYAQQQIAPSTPGRAASPIPAISTLIVLDPAHGATDSGATLGDHIAEKDITLALAARLRVALLSAGFTVTSTRDSDPTDPLTTDQRAEIANRSHPLACLVLHATASGSGVHVYTSALKPPAPEDTSTDTPSAFAPTPWDSVQASFIPQSLLLASAVGVSMRQNHIPAVSGQVPLRPLDNLLCPAIAVEIAPLLGANPSTTPVTDAAYQQQVATTLTGALRAWRDQSRPASGLPDLDSQTAAQSKAIAAAEAANRSAAAARSAHPAASAQKAPQ